MRAELPYSARRDMAVWRGSRTGGDPSTSLRGRVVDYCRGKRWADVQFVGIDHSRGLLEKEEVDSLSRATGEMRREEQAGYKVLLLIDGHTWASAWEWALASGSVIVFLGVWDWHATSSLVPWTHYVPCERVELIEERVLWVLAHPEEAEAMIGKAWELFRQMATPEAVRRAVQGTLVSGILPPSAPSVDVS